MSATNELTDDALVARAASLAQAAHQGQVDKQGRDYFQHHLLPIAEYLRPFGRQAYAAGLLHDIVEDTSVTYAQLADLGFDEVVIAAVRSVTKQDGEPYSALIARAAADPLGRLVKLADNWHNLSGVDGVADAEDRARLQRKYQQARVVLERSVTSPGRPAR